MQLSIYRSRKRWYGRFNGVSAPLKFFLPTQPSREELESALLCLAAEHGVDATPEQVEVDMFDLSACLKTKNKLRIRPAILLALLLGVSGCAGQRTRIAFTRVHGEPAISIEFEDAKEICK